MWSLHNSFAPISNKMNNIDLWSHSFVTVRVTKSKLQTVEKDPGRMRSAPPKPKCLIPPTPRVVNVNSKKQSSVDEVSNDLKYHRSLLFDQCEKNERKIKAFIQESFIIWKRVLIAICKSYGIENSHCFIYFIKCNMPSFF